jgi:hypothetical protein
MDQEALIKRAYAQGFVVNLVTEGRVKHTADGQIEKSASTGAPVMEPVSTDDAVKFAASAVALHTNYAAQLQKKVEACKAEIIKAT